MIKLDLFAKVNLKIFIIFKNLKSKIAKTRMGNCCGH